MIQKSLWKIWSIEHQAWWSPLERGYDKERRNAGVYSLEQALKIVKSANIQMNNEPNEAMVEAVECYQKVSKIKHE